jgi:hypothetical protein
MNVANLQLEGLIMAVAAMSRMLVEKGLLSADEVDESLRRTEASLTGEERNEGDLSPAYRDAVCFPIRFLRLANSAQAEGRQATFSELTRLVGRTKGLYNDQL